MDWVEEENEEVYLVFLDMEKAFDRCSWTFLIEGLEAIGFDQNFIDFVKLAYLCVYHLLDRCLWY